jgi:hypothetical protein
MCHLGSGSHHTNPAGERSRSVRALVKLLSPPTAPFLMECYFSAEPFAPKLLFVAMKDPFPGRKPQFPKKKSRLSLPTRFFSLQVGLPGL